MTETPRYAYMMLQQAKILGRSNWALDAIMEAVLSTSLVLAGFE